DRPRRRRHNPPCGGHAGVRRHARRFSIRDLHHSAALHHRGRSARVGLAAEKDEVTAERAYHERAEHCSAIRTTRPQGLIRRYRELRIVAGEKIPKANPAGASKPDCEQILQLHADYIDANARFDWQKLEPIWSAAPEAVFFNLNGHTYKGREHWIRLWKFYGQNVQSSYWTPFDVGGVVSDDMAVVLCHLRTPPHLKGPP